MLHALESSVKAQLKVNWWSDVAGGPCHIANEFDRVVRRRGNRMARPRLQVGILRGVVTVSPALFMAVPGACGVGPVPVAWRRTLRHEQIRVIAAVQTNCSEQRV